MIILQILFDNDICASTYIEEKVRETVLKDYKMIIQPFRLLFNENRIFMFSMRRIYTKIYQDLSEQRFQTFILNPLDKLLAQIDLNQTKLMILVYGLNDLFSQYNEMLEIYAHEKGIAYYLDINLTEDKKILSDRLPDGHPSENLNKALAEKLKIKVEEMISD